MGRQRLVVPRKIVYIAGPITLGNADTNFWQADKAMKELIDEGFAPINPMLHMRSSYAEEIRYDVWMSVALSLMRTAMCVLRLPGKSKGANDECQLAIAENIPVLDNIQSIKNYYYLQSVVSNDVNFRAQQHGLTK